MKKHCFVVTLIALLFATTACGSDFDLFNPTPADQLGPMRPDRPTKSISPWTVEPGHVQFETGLVDYAFQSQSGVDAHQLSVASTEIRVGLIDRLEFDAFVQPFIWQRVSDGGTQDSTGFGDLTLGVKYTVLDTTQKDQPDAGGFIMAVTPQVTLPTATDGVGSGGWVGSVGLPMEYIFPRSKFSLDDTPTLSLVPDQTIDFNGNDDGPHVQFSNAITLNYQQTQQLSEFIEFFAAVSSESGTSWQGTFDLGASYDLGHNWQVDGAVYIGVSRDAPDVEFTVGLSKRL